MTPRAQLSEEVVQAVEEIWVPEQVPESFWYRVVTEVDDDQNQFSPSRHLSEWLHLRLRYQKAKVSGDLDCGLDSEPLFRELLRECNQLTSRIKAAAMSREAELMKSEAKQLMQTIGLKQYEWFSEMAAWRMEEKLISPPPDTRHRRQRRTPATLRASFCQQPSRNYLHNLPGDLFEFIESDVPHLPTPYFWNRVREFVTPHFVAALLDEPHYRKLLALIIRRYAIGETESILEEVEQLQEAAASDGGGTEVQITVHKLVEFHQTLLREREQGWRYPPFPPQRGGTHSPGRQ